MDLRIEADPHRYEPVVRSYLAADPFTTNVLSIELAGVVAGTRPLAEGSIWLSVRDSTGRLVGAGMRTPPFNLFLPRLGDDVVDAVAERLAAAGERLPGVTGERGTAERFASRWRELTGAAGEVDVEMRLYVLGALRPPAGVPGAARPASDRDLDLVASWFDAFHEEAHPGSARMDPVLHAARRIANREIWLWEDGGQVVSMAAASAPGARTSRVGPVYTPPDRRRHGYGAAVTAAASVAAAEAGAAHVILYTDLANPVSNSIYQAIGYEPHHDSLEIRFAGGRQGDSIGA
jgi:predicted GNAT family acetyltransferase